MPIGYNDEFPRLNRLAFCLDRTARLGETHVGDVQCELASSCPLEQSDGRGLFVVSRGRIGIHPVRFNEHVRHVVGGVNEGGPP